MPRGQKSKLRAREKRHQARGEPKDPVRAQTTVPEGKESTSSPPGFGDAPQSLPAHGTPSNPQVLGGVRRTPAAAVTVSNAGWDVATNNHEQEMSDASHDRNIPQHWHRGSLDARVTALVSYLLQKYQRKEPITKAEMLRNVSLVHKHQFEEIFRRASDYVELVFGLDMKEMDPNRNTYVLINKLELSLDSSDNTGVPKTGLLMSVLGVIFMKGNCATEEDVWKMLNVMGIHAGREHFIFGEPKKLITEDLVKAGYLMYRQVPHSDPPRYQFLWGRRAYRETSKMQILELWAKLLGNVPSDFAGYYEEALREEDEKTRALVAARARTAARALKRARSKAMACRYSCPK